MFNYFKNKQVKKLREEWINPTSWKRDFSSISSLFELTCSDHEHGIVDGKTWNDLDMNSIFWKVDTTLTSVGQQYLYRKMRLLEKPKSSLEDDYRAADLLREDRNLREELQLFPKKNERRRCKFCYANAIWHVPYNKIVENSHNFVVCIIVSYDILCIVIWRHFCIPNSTCRHCKFFNFKIFRERYR